MRSLRLEFQYVKRLDNLHSITVKLTVRLRYFSYYSNYTGCHRTGSAAGRFEVIRRVSLSLLSLNLHIARDNWTHR